MEKFKVRFEVVLDSTTPEEAAKQALAYLKVAQNLEADVYGYLGPVRTFIKRVTMMFVKEERRDS